MYIQEKIGNNENVKRILNTYPPLLRTLHPSCVQGFFIMDCPHQIPPPFHPPPRPPPLHIYPFPIPAKQNKKPQAHINQLEAFHPS